MEKDLMQEIRDEQNVPYFVKDETILTIVKEAIYDTNAKVGKEIDYVNDLTARSFIKSYYLYASTFRLAEFREIYAGDLYDLQIKYNKDSNLS
jgi:hypothetical protein